MNKNKTPALPENLLGTQTHGPHPDLLAVDPTICVLRSPAGDPGPLKAEKHCLNSALHRRRPGYTQDHGIIISACGIQGLEIVKLS